MNVTHNQTFGIELECMHPSNVSKEQIASALRAAGVSAHAESYNHRTQPHWKVIYDGSISCPEGYISLEVVSPVLRGNSGARSLRKVCNVLKRLGCKVNKSCGTHVHIGTPEGFAKTDLSRLARFYARFEGSIDTVHVQSRRGSNAAYCSSMNGGRQFNARVNLNRVNTTYRYKKVNPYAFARYKTVEFRQLGGTLEAWKILSWANLCGAIVQRIARVKSQYRGANVTLANLFKLCKLDAESIGILSRRAARLARPRVQASTPATQYSPFTATAS